MLACQGHIISSWSQPNITFNFNWATAQYKIRFQMGQTYLNIFYYLYIIDYSTFEYSDIYSNIRIYSNMSKGYSEYPNVFVSRFYDIRFRILDIQ